MEWVLYLCSGCLLFDALILLTIYLALRFVKPQWPGWWERWIAAPYPPELDDYS